MRKISLFFGLGALLLTFACNSMPWHNKDKDIGRTFDRTPTAEQLVKYLNTNSQKIKGLTCRQAFIDAKQGGQSVGLEADVFCQNPRDFRLVGRVMGATEVEMGSNQQEFWYWIKRAEPAPGKPAYLYHCNYEDFRRGVAMPFPFQPDWIMEALGMATYDERKKYEVRETQTTVELIERSTTPQGQPVRKVTVFNRGPVGAGKPQVLAFILQDAAGKEIATAQVTSVHVDQATGAVVPKQINFAWPGEKVEMKMKFDGVQVGAIEPSRAANVFSRRSLASLPDYDLARPPGIERTGGFGPHK